jgi:multidrug efflux pump subunit AcrB
VPRYNLFPAAEVQGATLAGLSPPARRSPPWRRSPRSLPTGFGYEWTEIALQEKAAGNTAPIAFGLAVVFVFPAAGGAIREPAAAAVGHPDRADVPARRDHRRACGAGWTTTS